MTNEKRAAPQRGPVPVAGVMLMAHTIIAQDRVDDFIAECEEKNMYMHARRAFLEFVREFIERPLNKRNDAEHGTLAPASVAGAAPSMSLKALTLTAAARECDNSFKRKKTKQKT